MRSFVIASILLSSIVILTIFNTFHLTSRIDKMLIHCEDLKNGNSAETIESLLDEWQNCRTIMSLTTHRNDIERAENSLFAVKNFEPGDSDFYFELDILISALEHIRDSQSFTLENIF